MSREACIVLEALSRNDAKAMTDLLERRGLDVEREAEVVLVFASGTVKRRLRKNVQALRRVIRDVLTEAGLERALARPPTVRIWREERYRYADTRSASSPLADKDWLSSDLSRDEIRYVVDVVPRSAFALTEMRRDLHRLRRPILRGGIREFRVGARDENDAAEVAKHAEGFRSVKSATPRPLSRWQQWLTRQGLVGNYSSGPGEFIPWGDASGGDGGGGGGNGGG